MSLRQHHLMHLRVAQSESGLSHHRPKTAPGTKIVTAILAAITLIAKLLKTFENCERSIELARSEL
jgi:hypothetical protein